MLWIALIVFVGLLLVYILVVRPVLVYTPVLSDVFKAETSFFDQLRTKLVGLKTKIAARLLAISGFLVLAYDSVLPYFLGQDWTPVTAQLPAWAIPVGMMLVSLLFSYLRHVTENPLQVVTQKTEAGETQVVGLIKPAA
jgi:hypothetical protein